MHGTGKRHPAEDFDLDMQIGHVLRHAYHRASAHFARRLKPYDLNPQQFATLARLRELGPTSQNSLGDAVSMARANIHKMVERLRRRGLVETTSDPKDARRRIVALTDEGRELLTHLIPLDIASTEDALAGLSGDERKTLYELLRRIQRPAVECRRAQDKEEDRRAENSPGL